jgi:hypothetical protein
MVLRHYAIRRIAEQEIIEGPGSQDGMIEDTRDKLFNQKGRPEIVDRRQNSKVLQCLSISSRPSPLRKKVNLPPRATVVEAKRAFLNKYDRHTEVFSSF